MYKRQERDLSFSQNYACEDCGISLEELTPRMFSFNNPFGACPTCMGLGSQKRVDPDRIIPDKTKSILGGAIQASGWNSIRSDGISRMYFEALSQRYRFSLDTPWKDLSAEVRDIILYGTKGEKLELHYDQPRGKGVLYQTFEMCIRDSPMPAWIVLEGRRAMWSTPPTPCLLYTSRRRRWRPGGRRRPSPRRRRPPGGRRPAFSGAGWGRRRRSVRI